MTHPVVVPTDLGWIVHLNPYVITGSVVAMGYGLVAQQLPASNGWPGVIAGVTLAIIGLGKEWIGNRNQKETIGRLMRENGELRGQVSDLERKAENSKLRNNKRANGWIKAHFELSQQNAVLLGRLSVAHNVNADSLKELAVNMTPPIDVVIAKLQGIEGETVSPFPSDFMVSDPEGSVEERVKR